MARRKRIPYEPPETHFFRPSDLRDKHRERLCKCGLPRGNKRHKDFVVTEDMRTADAARLGERD